MEERHRGLEPLNNADDEALMDETDTTPGTTEPEEQPETGVKRGNRTGGCCCPCQWPAARKGTANAPPAWLAALRRPASRRVVLVLPPLCRPLAGGPDHCGIAPAEK